MLHLMKTQRPKAKSAAKRARQSRANRGVVKTITIELFSEDEVRQLDECFDRQAYAADRKDFYRESLLFGSKFRANAGSTPKKRES